MTQDIEVEKKEQEDVQEYSETLDNQQYTDKDLAKANSKGFRKGVGCAVLVVGGSSVCLWLFTIIAATNWNMIWAALFGNCR